MSPFFLQSAEVHLEWTFSFNIHCVFDSTLNNRNSLFQYPIWQGILFHQWYIFKLDLANKTVVNF